MFKKKKNKKNSIDNAFPQDHPFREISNGGLLELISSKVTDEEIINDYTIFLNCLFFFI